MEDGIDRMSFIAPGTSPTSIEQQTAIYESQRQRAIDIIENLYKTYENDPYMMTKTNHFICNQLPRVLETIQKNHVERVHRMENLILDQDTFIQSFLANHPYFYSSITEKFFFYDGLHYQVYSEDDILYHILTSITRGQQLMPWKQKTRITIMRRIREQSLLKTIPESSTIQHVISLFCPVLFSTKNEVKYFLTVLGDAILRKQMPQIHFMNPRVKPFIRELNSACQEMIGLSLFGSIKHKYHEHAYADCRILAMNDVMRRDATWTTITQDHVLDVICVACHYSNRYVNAEEFLMAESGDEDLILHTMSMARTTPDDLIHQFIHEYLDMDTGTNLQTTPIPWKNMQYLWKQFLDAKHFPSAIILQTAKKKMIERLPTHYNEEQDVFTGMCSKYLPAIQKFLAFWTETIVLDEGESGLEVEEVLVLFRKWCNQNHEYPSSFNNKQILDLVAYYSPSTEIEQDKYISHARCILWDKQLDIQLALDRMRQELKDKHAQGNAQTVSIYDAYSYYCKYHAVDGPKQYNVSKAYFEKYMLEHFEDFLIDSSVLATSWYLD
jgi:hypothetical protein